MAEQEAARKAQEEMAQQQRRARKIECAEAIRKAWTAKQEVARQARQARQEEARKVRQQQDVRRVEIAKEEAANTVQHVVLDCAVVTFGAGIAIQGILTGFESCRIWVKNLPLDAKSKEVCELFTLQGIEPARVHVAKMKRTPEGRQEALVICPEDAKLVAIGLDKINFREETLLFEAHQSSRVNGMRSSAGSSSSVLSISWHSPISQFCGDIRRCAPCRSKSPGTTHQGLCGTKSQSRHEQAARGTDPDALFRKCYQDQGTLSRRDRCRG